MSSTQRDHYLQEIGSVRDRLRGLLEGMDYCLDWKPADEEWSARDIGYHLVDTPPGGAHAALQGTLDGTLERFSITAGLDNLTPERRQGGLEALMEELEAVLAGLDAAVGGAVDSALDEKSVVVHSVTRSTNQQRTARELLDGIFLRHWGEHLAQLASLREALGLD